MTLSETPRNNYGWSHLLVDLFIIVIAYGVYATTYNFVAHIASPLSLRVVTSGAGTLILIAGAWFIRGTIDAARRRFSVQVRALSPVQWLLICLALGIALRLGWLLFCVPQQTSDFASYWQLAVRLVESGRYETAGTRAYWPPGLPFALFPSIKIFGAAWYVPAINNFLLFALSLVVLFHLAQRVANRPAAYLVMLLLALWPNFIFSVGLADKQTLLIVLVSSSIYFFVVSRSDFGRRALLQTVAAGGFLGAAILSQPSHILLPAVYIAHEFFSGTGIRRMVQRGVLLSLGVGLVVLPWTIRNYLTLDAFILVSNTSGISLYVGNNPNANGGYVEVSGLEGLNEVEANKKARALAIEWITKNPLTFSSLIVKKNIAFLGEDSDGAFWALKRGCGVAGPSYALAKGISNCAWLALLLLVLVNLLNNRNRLIAYDTDGFLLILMWFLYFFFIHSVFESGSRHHIAPTVGLMMLAVWPLGGRLNVEDSSNSTTALADQL